MNQFDLIQSQVDLDEALKNPKLSEAEKKKIILSKQVKEFAEKQIGLKKSKNYTGFVFLDRPYVSYVVNAAEKWKLTPLEWSYPFLGKMPYRGFFNETDAKLEADLLKSKNYDVFLRGVSAYSTLGWFRDPLLSSMLRYSDYDLVNTLIHETTHTTIYIKSNADFNERLAVFVGNKGSELFYLNLEGPNSPTLKLMTDENNDEKIFSTYITKELNLLEAWYQQLPESDRTEARKTARIKEIQLRFKENVLPQMKTKSYERFTELELNNARLLLYRTYVQDLSDFEKLYEIAGKNWKQFFEYCFQLEDSKDPAAELKKIAHDKNGGPTGHPTGHPTVTKPSL